MRVTAGRGPVKTRRSRVCTNGPVREATMVPDPSGVWLHGLDKAEPSSVEILDPVLSLECHRVVEYGELDAVGFAGQSIRAIR
jgi:hypothetical protein